MPTISTTATSVYAPPVRSQTLISVIDVINYKSTSEYNLLEATTSSALVLGATLSSSSRKYLLDKPCKGDITYYTTSQGVYGFTTNSNTEKVVALPHGLIGPESNSNLYYGKTITITYITTNKTITA